MGGKLTYPKRIFKLQLCHCACSGEGEGIPQHVGSQTRAAAAAPSPAVFAVPQPRQDGEHIHRNVFSTQAGEN